MTSKDENTTNEFYLAQRDRKFPGGNCVWEAGIPFYPCRFPI
jgi:hypothetical protein